MHRVLNCKIDKANPAVQCALGIMTKAPQPGLVKTRLVPPLTPEEAAQLNRCFLADTAAAILQACRETACGIGVYTPIGAETAYHNILPNEFALLPQRGDQFGERLFNAAADLFTIGFASVCLIDSDSPTVPAKMFSRAIDSLAGKMDRVVLGPSDDGGYYLIGIAKLHRRLFEKIDWSSERVLEQTKQRAAELGLELELLDTFYDVDERVTLRRLCNELLAPNVDKSIAPQTKKFLKTLIAQEGRERIFSG